MEPSPQLIDELYLDKVRQAQAMHPEQRLLAGLRLFDQACRIMLDGIRDQYPDLGADQRREILRQRLALSRRLEPSA